VRKKMDCEKEVVWDVDWKWNGEWNGCESGK